MDGPPQSVAIGERQGQSRKPSSSRFTADEASTRRIVDRRCHPSGVESYVGAPLNSSVESSPLCTNGTAARDVVCCGYQGSMAACNFARSSPAMPCGYPPQPSRVETRCRAASSPANARSCRDRRSAAPDTNRPLRCECLEPRRCGARYRSTAGSRVALKL